MSKQNKVSRKYLLMHFAFMFHAGKRECIKDFSGSKRGIEK